jgi:hypothetical protein
MLVDLIIFDSIKLTHIYRDFTSQTTTLIVTERNVWPVATLMS